MKKTNKRKGRVERKSILEVVNTIGDEINQILENKEKAKYFYAIILLYSFIENWLKHMSLIDTMWKQAKEGEISDEVAKEL